MHRDTLDLINLKSKTMTQFSTNYTKEQLKTMIDRPNLVGFDAFNKIFQELGLYLNDYEIDQIIEFMYQVENSEYDINPSISDSITQMQLILGKDRYQEVTELWKQNNQKTLSEFGTLKYKCKTTGNLYDGLDETDDPKDYEKVYV